jgi:putative ABC transport system permease protein
MNTDITFLEAAASLVLVVVAIGLSLGLGFEVERSIAWAALRAIVQLLAVGVLFTVIFESSATWLWAWLWVTGMVAIAAQVVWRRAGRIKGIGVIAGIAIGLSAASVIAVIFGFGVLDYEPVALVVIAGISIGNTVPSGVLAADRVMATFKDSRGQVEVLLASAFSRHQVVRFVGAMTARTALIPQIERTKVVGLIALPGAMTGLLLAGVDPIDAVLIQIVVMFLVLGSVATTVAAVTWAVASRSLTPDLVIIPPHDW